MMKKMIVTSLTIALSLPGLLSAIIPENPPEKAPLPTEKVAVGEPIGGNERAYPSDPNADIQWSAGFSGVADIQSAFNNARATENVQLGTSVQALTLPSQAAWNSMTDPEKAFWLVNRERSHRGVHPLHGLESNVQTVAQNYADYLLANNATGHTADGHDPWWRLDQMPAISGCHDFLSVSENLAYMWSSANNIFLPVERAVYMWMYEDAASAWGHRHAILWYPYNENSGHPGMEGFFGLGRASGPHQGWPFGELIVMNVFDPCASWSYGTDPIFVDGFESGDTTLWN